MGAGQSGTPRTVTIDNTQPIKVVNVSDDVVTRLKGQQPDDLRTANGGDTPSSYGNPARVPLNVHYGEPTISAIEVRRQKEEELHNNNLYWAKRLTELEQQLKKTDGIMEREYKAAVEDVRSRFHNSPAQYQKSAPCNELRAKVINCYRKYPNETLRCAQEVSDFTDRINVQRTKLVDSGAAA